ncbi:MAG: fibronectin type III domain-containing protein, partial [Kiritimatiellae bacterium]|nr:fibronectin type III domain-containing protein [Kiritimatiellia bacterium]
MDTTGGTSLTGSGLSLAAGTAVSFANSTDAMRYTGARSGESAFADYLLIIADESGEWDTTTGDGTAYNNYDTTAFTIAAGGGIWINPMSANTPMATYYLGDTMGSWNVNFEIGQASWDYAQVGIGTSTAGTDYNWGVANWYEDGTAPNKRVRRDLSGYQYTAVGSHYVICQARETSGDPYTSASGNGWSDSQTYPPADLSSAYFTCSALTDPSSQSATAVSSSQINLGWTRGVSGASTKDTVIFRSTSSTPPTLSQGTSYSQGTTYSGYYCVYKGSGTTHNDSASLSAGTQYYYFFYAENYSYYSDGVTANATTFGVPTLTSPTATSIGQTGATLGATVTANGGSALTSRGTVWGTSTDPTGNGAAEGGTSVEAFSHARSGLSQGTKYFYRGYAVNSVGTAYSPNGSFYTEPGQASSVTFSAVVGTTMTISWMDGANSDGSIVVVRAGNSTVDDPVDGTVYTGNAAYGTTALGSSYVVYAGNAETVDVTGLTGGVTYYVEVFSYKGTVETSGVDQGINYRQTSPETGNQATCTTPDAPTVSAESSVTSSGFTANWEAVSGATSYRLDVMTDTGGGGGGGGLFISEVTDPSDTANAKFVELYNASGSAIDFDTATWYVSRQANGGSWAHVQLTGSVGDGETYVLGYNQTDYESSYSDVADLYSGNISGNGDDGYFLCSGGGYGAGGTLVDSYGVIDQDGSGYDWEYENTRAVRNSDIISPSTTWTSSEWTIPSSANVADMTPHSHTVSGGSPDYVTNWEDVNVGNVTEYAVTGLSPSSTYYYWVRAVNACGTSANSDDEEVTTSAGTPSVTLADNGTQIAAGNVAAGTTDHVLHTFSLAVSTANATLTGVSFTSAGTYAAADLDNFKVYYSADNSLATTGDNTLLGTISTDLGAGTHSLSLLNQAIDAGDTGYIFITADIDSAAEAGVTVYVSPAIDTDDVTFASANKSGSTTAGGAQTITSAVTISLHASSPAAGNLAAGTANAVLFGFTLTPASGSFDFTGLVVDIAGTADSGDLSGFEIVYDADGDGVFDGGESVVSDTKAIGATITFVMSGQTGISAARSYLLIADVAASPTAGRTITASVDTVDVTTTGTQSGDADGAQQTIITAPSITTPTAADIAQTTATLGATLAANGGATVSDYGVVWNTAGTPTTSDNVVQESTTEPGMPDVFTVGATSLGQGTKVYYRGYAINSVNTAYSAQGSFYTEPGQAGDVQFANVTATGMRITWTAGADSDGAIVVVRAASAVEDGPTDGTEHSASTTFGSGANLGNSSYVVFRGDDSTPQVDVTGLTAGTTYHVAVYAYKGSGADSGADLGINYRQTSPATGNKPTLAAEPTTHSSSLSFSNIGAYSMDLSWTSGNGANRIVVVRQGSIVNWTPADGTAPSGDSADFSLAADQANGNKICYDGSGSGFTLSGLLPETTYHVTIFEYNGSATEVNYYLGGTPLSGSETTGEETCTPAPVVLLQRSAYYTAWGSGGGIFNNSGDTNELGQWANSGDMQSVAWRTFNTSGNGGGDAR